MGGEARTFGADGIFSNLYQQGLPFSGDGADIWKVRPARFAFQWLRQHIRDVDKTGSLKADIDKGRLHPRQDPHDFAFIDIANVALAVAAFDKEFLCYTVLYQGYAGFYRRDVNQNLFTHAHDSWVCQQGTLNFCKS